MNQQIIAHTEEKAENPWDEVFSDLPGLNEFDEFKRIEIASDLSALLVHSGYSRADIARSLNWTRSRITNVLSGDANPTVKTIYEFSRALGYDFDLTFRKPSDMPPPQPWQIEAHGGPVVVNVQTANEVFEDIQSGLKHTMYISFGQPNSFSGDKDMGYVDEVQSIAGESTGFSMMVSMPSFSMTLSEKSNER